MDVEKEIQDLKNQREEEGTKGIPLTTNYTGAFDSEIYGDVDKSNYDDYANDDNDSSDDERAYHPSTLNRTLKEKAAQREEEIQEMKEKGTGGGDLRVSNTKNEYLNYRQQLVLSPSRSDVFDGKTPARSYKTIMKEKMLDEEEKRIQKQIEEKEEQEAIDRIEKKRSKWDDAGDMKAPSSSSSKWDMPTPVHTSVLEATPSRVSGWDATPSVTPRTSNWDQTPRTVGETPGRKKSRWDETPISQVYDNVIPSESGYTPDITKLSKVQQEMEWRNRPLSDEDLDSLIPKGYMIVEPPPSYHAKTNRSNIFATPTPMSTPGFIMADTPTKEMYGIATPIVQDVPIFDEDQQFFGKLLTEVDDESLSKEEARNRKIMTLLLRIKNGEPAQRKLALKQITEKALEFGAGPLFEQILPILMSQSIEVQQRHLMVKVIDRILYKLEATVRPYVHKILIVIEPMLIDEDKYARIEGREIISNLAKAVGKAQMISTLKPDIDSDMEQVRNTTSRAFAVVASALGIHELVPFLKAVCNTKKSWKSRHTGIKTIQQIAVLVGCSVLPHLNQLVDCVKEGLKDEEPKVRTMAAMAISALAEASYPYGYESFDRPIKDLDEGIKTLRGKPLAAFIKAIGFIIPLMRADDANKYVSSILNILIREFQTPDEQLKKVVLKVVQQCVSTEGVRAQLIRERIMPDFFRCFWVRRIASDKKSNQQLVETTVEIAKRVGCNEVVGRLVNDLKDENEKYRSMVMDAIQQIIEITGMEDVDTKLEELLLDGMLYSFQEQTGDDEDVTIKGFAVVLNALGLRARPYLQQLTYTLKSRFENRNAKVRMQAADLVAKIAEIMKKCGEDNNLKFLGGRLYEFLGEEYPEVLGSILNALKCIVNVMGMDDMNPPIKDLLPHLTPILRNRNEKVQENCIDLVGRIADKGSEFVSPREWSRICFDLLEMLNAHKKAIRRATINTFGYIAKALGPSDVLFTLLNNLKVQERQNRVCTTIAIAVVAETCGPFTVIPFLMNEYRTPEMNVQNGVLKSFAFMFEYIGEMSKNYIYSIIPLFEDALMDRDMIHRQQASAALAHLFVGVYALNCEDAVQDLLNYVWPNIFEVSPHLNKAVFAAIESGRLALGASTIFMYTLQGLFHPARRVREIYWKIYNNLYIYAADGLTQAYPRLENDQINTYDRDYLDMFI